MHEINIELKGLVSEIQRYAIHDGPGIRTLVFLKGCPLRCLWCANPETQRPYPEMAYFKEKCIRCGRCVQLCPYKAIKVSQQGELETDWKICLQECYLSQKIPFECTKKCYSGARRVIGDYLTVEQVMDEVLRDYSLYERTGGGITISGGEPLAQTDFTLRILKRSKEINLHTAIETCSLARWEDFERIAEYLDWVFYDIKTIDPLKHKELTGFSNDLILENIKKLSEISLPLKIHLIIRIPVVPGYTDSPHNIWAISKFVSEELRNVKQVELLPYHRLGRHKYKAIGAEYTLFELKPPQQEEIIRLEEIVKSFNLESCHT